MELQQVCSEAREEDPHLIAVAKVVPAISERLRTQTSAQMASHELLIAKLDDISKETKETQMMVSDLLQGHFSLQFTPKRGRMLPQGLDAQLLRQQQESRSPCPAGPSTRFPRTPSPSNALSAPTAPQPISLGGPAPLAAPGLHTGEQVPTYKLSRDIRTIPALWREWTTGLAGMPSVEELDRRYGCKWRPRGEAQYYSTRKRIIDEIRRRAGAQDPALTVATMEVERAAAKASLDKVQKMLLMRAKQE